MKRRHTISVIINLLSILLFVACTELPKAPQRVTLVADGQQRTVETQATTVREVLVEQAITLKNLDHVTPPETARISTGMAITVTRVQQTTETYTETLAFGRQTMRDANVPTGETRLLQSGQPGILERVYRITLEDGTEIERVMIQESVIQEPRDEVQLIGTRPQVSTQPITGTLVYLNTQDAWSMRKNNRTRYRLTALGDLDGRVFELSPDGSKLLFTRAMTEPEHINDLWMIRTREADPNPIPLNVQDLLWAGWSPDNRRIAWTTAEPTDEAPGWRGQNDLWIASLSEQNILTTKRKLLDPEAGGGYGWWGTAYTWSPDGEKLAYSRPESVGIITLRSPKRTPLISFPAYRTYSSWAWHPIITWNATGEFFATVIHGPAPDQSDPEESPVFDLWLIEATGAYSAEVASEVGMWAAPNFHPDGEDILFGRALVPYQSAVSTYSLCTIDRDGSNATCLYPQDENPGIELPSWHWSPDGTSIAFIQYGDIYIFSIDEGTARPLTDEGGITLLAWQ